MFADEFEIAPAGRALDASIRVPGSKSITNRAMLLAAMADGTSLIDSVLLSEDTYSMAAALRTLAQMPAAGRRIAVLGRMGELGVLSRSGHQSVGEIAAELNRQGLSTRRGTPWRFQYVAAALRSQNPTGFPAAA